MLIGQTLSRLPATRSRIWLCFLSISIVGGMTGCHRIKTIDRTAPEIQGDSVQLIDVRQIDGNTLHRGTPSQIVAHLRYTLDTRDSAILVLSLDQFHNSKSCIAESTEAVDTVSERRVSINHGTQTVEVSVTWPGGSTSGREHEEYPEGAISLRASLLSEKPPYRFLSEWFGTEYCQQF